ncbi:MAG: PKD domain-containing protein [Bacteroidota bacterium]
MNRTRFLLLIACFLLGAMTLPQTSRATHIQGIDFTYECLDSCTIRAHLRAYRNCSLAVAITNQITFNPVTPGCGQPTALTGWSPQVTVEVTPVCISTVTMCGGAAPGPGVIPGVQEYYWFRDYDICSVPNCIFQISWGDCCRNSDITSGQANQGMGISATTLNTTITPCNSSPQFLNPPVPYICQGQPYVFNQGAYDPEGDSLAYSIGPCYTNTGAQVTYNGGYSATSPLGPTWSISIDAVTGDITVIPMPGNVEIGVLCIYVEEWRNGVLLNTIVRDMQINVIPCPGNTLPSCSGVTNVTGGSAVAPFEVSVCAGTQLTFDVPIVDPDAGQVQTLVWNQNIPGATFTGSGMTNAIVGNQPTGTFTWTPTQTGFYTFLVTAFDDACPIYGQNQYTIIINVVGGIVGASINATPTGCVNVSLSANPGTANTGPYTYSWFGDGNLSINTNNTQQTLSHTYPGPGSYEVNCQITDAFGCVHVITDTVIIPNGPTAGAGPDISICSGNSIVLGEANLPPGQAYLWTPATGLSNPADQQPTFSYTLPGNQPDTINFSVTATSGFCTAIDYCTVVVYPIPAANITGNVNICLGQSTTLTASGGTDFLWSTGETTQSITVSPGQNTVYSVTVSNAGCASPPASVIVFVSQGPTALISGQDMVCAGDDVTLTATGGSSWLWSTGEVTQTITVSNVQGSTTVSVVASDGGCDGPPASFTVDLHEKPAADFSAPEMCVGNQTMFTDLSSLQLGNVVAWTWDFGDPVTGAANNSFDQHPFHAFSDAGTYTVTLIVTADNGCLDTIQQQIIVNPLPVADFDFEEVCDGERVNFNDLSTSGAGVSGWHWDFGDGATSQLQNPTHLFATAGAQNVTLTVTDGHGCSNQIVKTILVHPNPVAEFSWTLHCFNTLAQFTSNSFLNDPLGTTLDAHSWNFGDPASGAENTSSDINPSHTWAAGPGVYNVSLTVTTSQGCTNTITIPVAVGAFNPLLAQHDTICRGYQATVSVLGQAPNTTVEWFYTPNGVDPFNIGSSFFHTEPLPHTTTWYVGMRDQDGCLSPLTAVKAVVIPEPWVDWSASATELNIPNAITEFTVSGVHNGPVTAYTWDFGDGTTSGEINPVHEYTEEGWFDVSITVINEWGCTSTQTLPQHIHVEKNPHLIVPNIFTPNGDDLNDQFFVVTKLITDFHIDIYDRWGKLLYQSDDMSFRWDGNFGGAAQPEGVYTYVINAVEWGGEKIQKAGTVTLTR